MLPPAPPPVTSRDFDPASIPGQEEADVEMDEEEEEQGGSRVELSSVEINILIYLYLLESNLSHTAFTLLSESSLPSTSLFQHFHPSYPTPSNARGKGSGTSGPSNAATSGTNGGPSSAPNSNGPAGGGIPGSSKGPAGHAFGKIDGRIERGELIRKLWKGLRWEEVERHVAANGVDFHGSAGKLTKEEPFRPQCPNPFHLLIPHTCPTSYPSHVNNPPLPLPTGLRVSPPPPKRPEVFPPPDEVAPLVDGETEAEAEPEAGPSRSRPRKTAGGVSNGAVAGSAKRSRVIRGSSEDPDQEAESSRRSASPDRADRKGAKREKEREKDRDKKRSRLSDVDSDRDKDKGKSRLDKADKSGRDRDPLKGVQSGKDRVKDKDRDKDKERDNDGTRLKNREKDKDKDRVSRLSGRGRESETESVTASREDSPAPAPKRRKGYPNTSLAPPGKSSKEQAQDSRSRDRSPGSTASGPTGGPASRGPGRPPKTAPSDSRPAATPGQGSKRSKAEKEREDPTPATPSSPAESPLRLRMPDKPDWIPDTAVSVHIEHRDAVGCLAWNPRNRSVLASASNDGTARTWEFADSPPSSQATRGKGTGEDVDMDDGAGPNGTLDAAAVPPLQPTKRPLMIKHIPIDSSKKALTTLAWHPEGSMMATGSGDGIGRLITPDGTILRVMTSGSGGIVASKFSPSGRFLLTAKGDCSVALWDMTKGESGTKQTYTPHSDEVQDVDWLDDDVFATSGNDHKVHVFRTSDRTVRYTFSGHADDVTRVRWSPYPCPASALSSLPRSSASASRPSASLFPSSGPSAAQLERANHLLASVSDDGYLCVWRMPAYPAERPSSGANSSRSASPVKGGVGGAGYGERERERYERGVGSASEDGDRDRAKSRDRADRDTKEGILDSLLANASATNGAKANGANHAAGAGSAPTGEVGRTKNGKPLPENCVSMMQVVDSDIRRLCTLEWAPMATGDQMIVAAGAVDTTVKLFNALTGELLFDLAGLENGVSCLSFSRALSMPFDGLGLGLGLGIGGVDTKGKGNERALLAAADWLGQVCIYDATTGRKVGEWMVPEDMQERRDPQMRVLAWREDGKHLAMGNGAKGVFLMSTNGLWKRLLELDGEASAGKGAKQEE